MSPKGKLVSAAGILAATALLVWLFSGNGPQPTQPAPSGKTSRPARREMLPHPSPDPPERIEEARREWENAAVPVDFYGRVVGPDGKGVPGVEVSWRAGVASPHASPGTDWTANKTGSCTTGPDGRFEVHAGRGVSGRSKCTTHGRFKMYHLAG